MRATMIQPITGTAPPAAAAWAGPAAVAGPPPSALQVPDRLALSPPAAGNFVPGEALVRLRPGLAASDVAEMGSRYGFQVLRRFASDGPLAELYQVQLGRGLGLEATLGLLNRDPRIVYAEPNFLYRPDEVAAPPQRRPTDLHGWQ